MLVCAHPAIDRAVRTPLMLNTVLGFTAEQVGRAFSVPPSTMATRLVRAKKRIKAAGIPFRIPDRADLPARMISVLEAVYGAYVIDWSTGPQARRLPSEALQLAEVLATLVPDDPEARGLAAFIEFRPPAAPARADAGGRFVPLAEQDPVVVGSAADRPGPRSPAGRARARAAGAVPARGRDPGGALRPGTATARPTGRPC